MRLIDADALREDYGVELREKRPEGSWLKDIRVSGWICSWCGYQDGSKTDKYCPNCGIKMSNSVERR